MILGSLDSLLAKTIRLCNCFNVWFVQKKNQINKKLETCLFLNSYFLFERENKINKFKEVYINFKL